MSKLLSTVYYQIPNHDLFITGDFNIDLLTPDNKDFHHLLLSHNIYPTIFYTTRVAKNSATLIDNILTKVKSLWSSGVINSDIFDHHTIFTCVYYQNADPMYVSSNTYICADAFVKHVANHKWDFITDASDLNEDCTRMESSLMNSVNYAKRESKSRIYTYPWMNSAIFTSCKQKNILNKKMRKGLVSENECKTYRNQLTNLG